MKLLREYLKKYRAIKREINNTFLNKSLIQRMYLDFKSRDGRDVLYYRAFIHALERKFPQYTINFPLDEKIDKLILSILKSIEDGLGNRSQDPNNQTVGICGMFSDRLYVKYDTDEIIGSVHFTNSICRRRLRKLFRLWPEFSGDIVYPVCVGESGERDYDKAINCWIGEYGEARIRLLKFMIKELETNID